MDAIFGIITIVVVYAGIIFGLRALRSGVSAGFHTLTKGGNIVDNFRYEFKGMGPFESKIELTTVPLGDRTVRAYQISVRGLINATYKTDLGLQVSILDQTGGKSQFVLSSLDWQQEPATTAFEIYTDAGAIQPNQGFRDWVKIGLVFPETLIAPYSGKRTLKFVIRAMEASDHNKISFGFHSEDAKIFAASSQTMVLQLDEKGWLESGEQRRELKVLGVRLAVALAAADGVVDGSEANIIHAWMQKNLDEYDGEVREKFKSQLNSAFKESVLEAESGQDVDTSSTIARIKAIDMRAGTMAIMELLMSVAGADGDIDESELKKIYAFGADLGIDYSEIKGMTEKALLDSDVRLDTQDSAEAILGIDPSWPRERVREHLRDEFKKWNGRIQSLTDPVEREKAQRMIDAIGEARKKLG